MPDLHQLRKVTRLPLTDAKAKATLYPLQVGMPSLDSIHDDSITFKSGKRTFRVLRTTEVDTYEKTGAAKGFTKALHGRTTPATKAIMAAAKRPPSTGEQFGGKDRKAAKLSIGTGKTENFTDLSKLIATLPSRAVMAGLKIPHGAASGRVSQEQRNIHLTAFLYAASREADNDYHLIVGRDPKAAGPPMYMTMEISGLPPAGNAALAKISAARTAYKKFFGSKLPLAGYDFYSANPIPVVIEGSLFWDATHSTGQAPGPPSLKPNMPTIWEVHPITSIKLG